MSTDSHHGRELAAAWSVARSHLPPQQFKTLQSRETQRAADYWRAFKLGESTEHIPQPGQHLRDALRARGLKW